MKQHNVKENNLPLAELLRAVGTAFTAPLKIFMFRARIATAQPD